ncbi:MAG: hypothetical protein ABSE97_08945 [Verrucomicrobiota bacterium]|jgi:hypothetical protein
MKTIIKIEVEVPDGTMDHQLSGDRILTSRDIFSEVKHDMESYFEASGGWRTIAKLKFSILPE